MNKNRCDYCKKEYEPHKYNSSLLPRDWCLTCLNKALKSIAGNEK